MIDFSSLYKLRTELAQAIKLNNVEQLRLLLNTNLVNLNYVDKEGQTLLHRSCQLGHTTIVEVLCEFGASQHIKNLEGWFPIHLAAYYGHMDIVYYLLKQQTTSTDILVIEAENRLNRSLTSHKVIPDEEEEDDDEDFIDEEKYHEDNAYLNSSYNEHETDDEDKDNEEEDEETNELLMLNFSNLKL